ncbi:hypothetical protein MBGDF03_00917 [Thermoplasmatales archaeon SCGC AB-540-F20]|nr:hypothetical protein MBGDF03_00917 [Thermoplasmatales archaeon SCGC AB-540-F20]
MCGAGTTLIESCIQKKYCTGIDIDPVAILTSKVSTTPIENEQLNLFQNSFLKELNSSKNSKAVASVELPNEKEYPNYKLWFREETLQELLFIKQKIFEIEDENLRNLAKLSLSNITKLVSNADPRDIFPERDLKNPIREKKDVFKKFSIYFR